MNYLRELKIEFMQEDYRVRDNLAVALNILNKRKLDDYYENVYYDRAKRNKFVSLYSVDRLYMKARRISKSEKISVLDASLKIKNKVKGGVTFENL